MINELALSFLWTVIMLLLSYGAYNLGKVHGYKEANKLLEDLILRLEKKVKR